MPGGRAGEPGRWRRFGYARVSTRTQDDETQLDKLAAAGCKKVFTDQGVSGKHASRPELDKCLAYLREGDTLVITRLSRAMRSLRHLLDLAAELQERGIGLVMLKQDLDTTSSTGRLVFYILAAIDEWQRELIVEGTHEGLAAARARGKTGGRKPKLTSAQVNHARELYAAGQHTVADIAGLLARLPPDDLPGARFRSLARLEGFMTTETNEGESMDWMIAIDGPDGPILYGSQQLRDEPFLDLYAQDAHIVPGRQLPARFMRSGRCTGTAPA